MDCPLILVGNTWQCPDCGRRVPAATADPPRATCQSPAGPELRAARLAERIAATTPGVTAAEIERRLAVCRPCESFYGDGCAACQCADRSAWFAGLIFDAAAPKRWLCTKWLPGPLIPNP
ncbi:MAG: hypothetical protein ABSG68_26390 [Thermoguttaceae bacterium]|jgi:hypothetical protein